MKKRLLIQQDGMSAGGTEVSMLNFIENMKDTYDIDVHLFNDERPFQQRLEKTGVRILQSDKHLDAVSSRISDIDDQVKYADDMMRDIAPLEGRYDAAIAYSNCYPTREFVLRKVDSGNKMHVIHMDPTHRPLTNAKGKSLSQFDKILCVSSSLKSKVADQRPDLIERLDVLRNFQDTQGIIEKSKEEIISHQDKKVHFVSPIRLTDEKAPLRTARVISQLVNDKEADNFVWTILGDGNLRGEMEQYIEANNLAEYIRLAGTKANPYPYIASSDFLLLASMHEAAPMTYGEANVLGVPVVSTRTTSAEELVTRARGGIVCDNSEQGIHDALKQVLTNRRKLTNMKHAIQGYEYPNQEIKQSAIELIG